MSIAALKQRITETKPSELEHLYVDGDDQLRDRHIEAMFNTLFYGEDLDAQFAANFTLYATMLLGNDHTPPPDVFIDRATAHGWVAIRFGLLHVTDNVTGDTANDPELAHCTHRARLRTRFADNLDDAFAPSAHHATLLVVVAVFRQLAERWHEQQFGD